MWKAIIIWLRNFFGFSRSEANGFVLLLFLMLIILFAPLINKQFLLSKQPDLFLASDYKELDSLLLTMESQLEELTTDKKEFHGKDYGKIELHNFDPNTASSETLQTLGVPEFLAKRMLKYRNLVKPFQNAEDLLLIYGMDSSLYRNLKPYVKIKESELLSSKTKYDNSDFVEDSSDKNVISDRKSPKKYVLASIDINTADTAQLKKIYGIGAVYAQRIIDFRDLLGGFASKDQYNEIYGLKSPNLDSLKKYTIIDETLQLKQLKINTCSEEEMSKHPYISYNQAKLIVSFRNAHGPYESIEDLVKIKVIDTSFTSKIKPYIKFEL